MAEMQPWWFLIEASQEAATLICSTAARCWAPWACAAAASAFEIAWLQLREFSAVCPYSGLPDYALLRVAYTPSDRCIELKSLKYYVMSYRSVGIFQEHATARIAEDLFRALQPKHLEVTTIYNVRGGFETTCTVQKDTR